MTSRSRKKRLSEPQMYLGTAGESGLDEAAYRALGIKASNELMTHIGASSLVAACRAEAVAKLLPGDTLDGRKQSQAEEKIILAAMAPIKTVTVDDYVLAIEIRAERCGYDFRLIHEETGLAFANNIKTVRKSSNAGNVCGITTIAGLLTGQATDDDGRQWSADSICKYMNQAWYNAQREPNLQVRDYFMCVVGQDCEIATIPLLALAQDALVANADNGLQARNMHAPTEHEIILDRPMEEALGFLVRSLTQVRYKVIARTLQESEGRQGSLQAITANMQKIAQRIDQLRCDKLEARGMSAAPRVAQQLSLC